MNILLVHGLGRTPLSLFGLAVALRRSGHRPSFFAYSPTLERLPRILRRLTARLRSLAKSRQPVGLVGHSLGGVLLRMALVDVPELPVHQLVMLGTPNRSSHLARLAWRWFPFRWLTRDCGRLLGCPETLPGLPAPVVPYTLIAGTAGLCGGWTPFGSEANDGIVAVSEVSFGDRGALRQFPVWHTFMMNNPDVRQVVIEAMMTGSDHTPPPS